MIGISAIAVVIAAVSAATVSNLVTPPAVAAAAKTHPADARLAAIDAHLKSNGHKFKTKRSPVFDKVAQLEALSHEIHLKAGFTNHQIGKESFKAASRSVKGLKLPANLHERIKAKAPYRPVLPRATQAQYDIRPLGFATDVDDQMQCGDCYNFSADKACMSAEKKAGVKNTVTWSYAHTLACSNTGGCDGGFPSDVMEWLLGNTDNDATQSPYNGAVGQCSGAAGTHKIDAHGYVGSDSTIPDEQSVKDAILAYGQISVCVAADDNFMAYSSGIFTGPPLTAGDVDHAVNLLGWDDTTSPPCWIMQNHWNESWGEKGCMRIARNSAQIGYAAAWAKINGTAPVPPGPTPPVPPVPPAPNPPTPAAGSITIDLDKKTVTVPGGYTPVLKP
ncbi:FB22 precursor [Fimbriiglobus ruber]|uniref:FB22 n=1 Tax=Fimbriiglobus ruber TaxID=1908690 RepID=A0A225CY46_9BACT|nr:FB22 precursor [Fimbriiglobus ruber]